MDKNLESKLALRVLYDNAVSNGILRESFLKEQYDIIESNLNELNKIKIDNKIAEWCRSNTELSVHKYIGMTLEEYREFVDN